MYSESVFKTVIAMFLSATMAFPASLWAKDGSSEPSGASADQDATDGIPVILEPVQLKDGRTGYFIIAPYLESQEASVVAHFAANDPKHLILGVAGPDDPALQTALESGNLAWISSYIVADAEQANAIQKAPVSLRQRLKDKIKKITDLCKREKVGLITAMTYSGIVGTYVGIHSAAVPAGMKAFAALFAWAGFQAVASGTWEGYLDWGGDKFTKFMIWALGRDINSGERNFGEAVGKFHATWAANILVAGGILAASGESRGFNVDGFLQAMWYGFLGSTDILDAAVGQKIKQGILRQDFFRTFVIMRMVAAACFEVAGYLHIDHVQAGMATVTAFTFIYLALSHLMDPKIEERKIALKNASLRARANAGRFVYAAKTRRKVYCEERLSRRKSLSIANGEPAE